MFAIRFINQFAILFIEKMETLYQLLSRIFASILRKKNISVSELIGNIDTKTGQQWRVDNYFISVKPVQT